MAAPIARKGPRVTVRAKGAARDKSDVRGKLRAYYKRVKSLAIAKDNAERERVEVQRETVAYAKEHDLDKTPITFTLDGVGYVATISSPGASPTWDMEKIVDYLHRTGRWDSCSTQVFDQKKWESEIESGNIPKATAKKFIVPGKPPTPYCNIRKV